LHTFSRPFCGWKDGFFFVYFSLQQLRCQFLGLTSRFYKKTEAFLSPVNIDLLLRSGKVTFKKKKIFRLIPESFFWEGNLRYTFPDDSVSPVFFSFEQRMQIV